ncbi:MAG: hypothetical protein HKN78_09220, partial [Sphingomonadaceae bacterium]|nr:hypothetical protein [Sphingomonadaceae bacterium]
MAIWKMTSKEEYNYKPEVAISFAPYSGSNVLAGTITFRGIECRIFGQWGPAGSLPDRKYSAFAIWASNQAEAM